MVKELVLFNVDGELENDIAAMLWNYQDDEVGDKAEADIRACLKKFIKNGKLMVSFDIENQTAEVREAPTWRSLKEVWCKEKAEFCDPDGAVMKVSEAHQEVQKIIEEELSNGS